MSGSHFPDWATSEALRILLQTHKAPTGLGQLHIYLGKVILFFLQEAVICKPCELWLIFKSQLLQLKKKSNLWKLPTISLHRFFYLLGTLVGVLRKEDVFLVVVTSHQAVGVELRRRLEWEAKQNKMRLWLISNLKVWFKRSPVPLKCQVICLQCLLLCASGLEEESVVRDILVPTDACWYWPS